MKRLIATSMLALTVALAGCAAPVGDKADPTPEPPRTIDSGDAWSAWDDNLYAETVILPDGREIVCVIFADQPNDKSIGGLSCDWDTANGVFEEPR